MNPSGRCELLDLHMVGLEFSSNDPILWLKAASGNFDSIAKHHRYKSDVPAGFAIPGHIALSKYLKIPQVSASKQSRIVAFEAKQNIPYPFEEVTWDYTMIQQDDLDFDVLIGAARTEVVEAISRYCKDSKINLQCIEPTTTALVNGFRFNYPDASGCTLVVSIGSKSTEMVFIEGSRFHSRSVPFGGYTLSVELAEQLGIPVPEAERIKLAAIAGEPMSPEKHRAFDNAKRSFLGRLVTETGRTVAVLKRQGYEFDPDQCYLAGGGSLLPGIEEELSAKLGAEVNAYNPLRKIHVPNDALREKAEDSVSLLCDAIGLGVSRFLPDAAKVDLTPRSLVWQRKFRRQQPFYIVAGLVACASVALPLFNTALEMRTYRLEIQNLDTQIKPLSQLNQQIYEKTEDIKRLRSVVEKTRPVEKARSSWIVVFNDLQQRLSEVEDVWLDTMELERPPEKVPSGRGQARVQNPDERTKLKLGGRLIDVRSPLSQVSADSYKRVTALLDSFRSAEYVDGLEDERFDYSVPGILKFDFTLILNLEAHL